jgi:predicted nucleic acid-binding Zn ribbon protein
MAIDFREHSNKQSNLASEINSILGEVKQLRKKRFGFWNQAVGDKIAEVAVPVFSKNGVLMVKVQDAVWRFELTRRKQEILDKVNSLLNENSKLKDILFK